MVKKAEEKKGGLLREMLGMLGLDPSPPREDDNPKRNSPESMVRSAAMVNDVFVRDLMDSFKDATRCGSGGFLAAVCSLTNAEWDRVRSLNEANADELGSLWLTAEEAIEELFIRPGKIRVYEGRAAAALLLNRLLSDRLTASIAALETVVPEEIDIHGSLVDDKAPAGQDA